MKSTDERNYLGLTDQDVKELALSHAEPLPKEARNFYRDGFKVAINVFSEILVGSRTVEEIAVEYHGIYIAPAAESVTASPYGALFSEYRKLSWVFGFVTGFNYAKGLAAKRAQTPVTSTMSQALQRLGRR